MRQVKIRRHKREPAADAPVDEPVEETPVEDRWREHQDGHLELPVDDIRGLMKEIQAVFVTGLIMVHGELITDDGTVVPTKDLAMMLVTRDGNNLNGKAREQMFVMHQHQAAEIALEILERLDPQIVATVRRNTGIVGDRGLGGYL